MLNFQKFAVVTASAAALLAAAGSAQAVTFASVSGANTAFVNETSGPYAGGGMFIGNGKSFLSFLMAGLPTHLKSTLSFINTGTTQGAAASTSGGLTTYTEAGFTGLFQDIYAGPTATIDGVHLVENVTDLLSGTISSGVLTGYSMGATQLPGTFDITIQNYSSPYAMGVPNGGADLNLALANPRGHWAINTTYGNLQTAQFTASGGFIAVPEPAAWALMLLGVGGIGATLRRRHGAVATTA